MAQKHEDVVKFESVVRKTLNDNLGNDKKEEALIEAFTMLYTVLVDIREALKPEIVHGEDRTQG
jgi:hypothetical protein